MKFKRHILMTSAAATLAVSLSMGAHAYAQDAAAEAAPAGESQTVIVTGIRKSLQSALKQKRNSDSVSEVITAEDIGKFPDKNVADSLSRATGVNVVTGSANAGGFGENERISIRGTDPELNLTLLDGHNMATGDWFVLDQTSGGRSFNYGMLPSEVVGSIEVIKSSSADLPEGGIGGTVDVHVRKPLDLAANTFAASAQALYATRPDKVTPNVSGMYSWKNEGRTFGILVGAFYEKRDFRRDGQEVLGYASAVNFANSGKTLNVPSLIGSAYFQQERVREGGNFVAQWKPSDKFELDVSGLYTYLKADNSNHNFMFWGSNLLTANSDHYISDGAGGQTLVKALGIGDPGSTLQSYTASGDYVTAASWAASSTNAIVQDDIFRQAHSSSYVLNADATWHLNDKWTVKGQIGYTSGEGTTDDSAAWETTWNNVGASYELGNPVAHVSYPGLPTDPTSAAYLNNGYSWSWGGKVESPDKETYAKIDVDYAIDSGVFKNILFGARATDHTREINDIAYSWPGNGDATLVKNLAVVYKGDRTPSDYAEDVGDIPGYTYANGQAVYDFLDNNAGGRTFGFYAPASFAVKEKTEAYYAMTKLGGDMWRGNIGLRAVHTEDTAVQYSTGLPADQLTNDSVFGKYGEVDTAHEYWDYLPSANLIVKPNDQVVIRAGVSKVMTRPGYAQLAGAYYLDDANHTGTAGGNPDLEPYRAWQYNLGAEWYYSPEALFSVTLFDLQIDNYITTNTFTGFYTDVLNPDGATFTLTGPANGGSATDKGFELNLQQPVAYGFGFIANFTYSDAADSSGEEIDGNSKYTYNLTGYYENNKVSARLAYNFRSKFKSGTDRATPMWQDDYGTLDGSFSYNLNDHIALTLDAQNLLNHKLYYFVGNPNIPRAYYDYGQTFYAGVRLKY
jgi:iron complex outermembrane receptor protein